MFACGGMQERSQGLEGQMVRGVSRYLQHPSQDTGRVPCQKISGKVRHTKIQEHTLADDAGDGEGAADAALAHAVERRGRLGSKQELQVAFAWRDGESGKSEQKGRSSRGRQVLHTNSINNNEQHIITNKHPATLSTKKKT